MGKETLEVADIFPVLTILGINQCYDQWGPSLDQRNYSDKISRGSVIDFIICEKILTTTQGTLRWMISLVKNVTLPSSSSHSCNYILLEGIIFWPHEPAFQNEKKKLVRPANNSSSSRPEFYVCHWTSLFQGRNLVSCQKEEETNTRPHPYRLHSWYPD